MINIITGTFLAIVGILLIELIPFSGNALVNFLTNSTGVLLILIGYVIARDRDD